MPVLTVLVVSLSWAEFTVGFANSVVVERWRSDNGNPFPTEASLGAFSVSHLADLAVWISSALSLPSEAEPLVVERSRNFNIDPFPTKASC